MVNIFPPGKHILTGKFTPTKHSHRVLLADILTDRIIFLLQILELLDAVKDQLCSISASSMFSIRISYRKTSISFFGGWGADLNLLVMLAEFKTFCSSSFCFGQVSNCIEKRLLEEMLQFGQM